jgi:hypothetical protein
MSDVDTLLQDIADLEAALDHADDPAQATRLRLTLASRRAQLADLQQHHRRGR